MIFLTGKLRKVGRFYFKFYNGLPENLKDENDGEDWWVCQFHMLPFIMIMMDIENIVTFGWLFWSVVIMWNKE